MTDAFYESRAWLDLRYRVLQKSKGRCEACGSHGEDGNPIQVDHIKPRSLHPELALAESNLQVLCRRCNMGKSNTDSTDWRIKTSQAFEILESADPASKAKLQQLGWLKINGTDKYMKREAEAQYKKLWADVEAEWKAKRDGEKT